MVDGLDVSYGCAFFISFWLPFFDGLFVVFRPSIVSYSMSMSAHGSFLFIPRTVKPKRYVISFVCLVVLCHVFVICRVNESNPKPNQTKTKRFEYKMRMNAAIT